MGTTAGTIGATVGFRRFLRGASKGTSKGTTTGFTFGATIGPRRLRILGIGSVIVFIILICILIDLPTSIFIFYYSKLYK
jgi:hypothetical protein